MRETTQVLYDFLHKSRKVIGNLEHDLEDKSRMRCHSLNEEWRKSAEESANDFKNQHQMASDNFLANIEAKNKEINEFKEELDQFKKFIIQNESKTEELEFKLKNSEDARSKAVEMNDLFKTKIEQMQANITQKEYVAEQERSRIRETHEAEKASLRDTLSSQHRQQLEDVIERIQDEGKKQSQDLLSNEEDVRQLWNTWENAAEQSAKA